MLFIHTSNHLEKLKEQYENLVSDPLDDILKTETVVVQNAGMARWLSIEMAKTSGISANTEFLFPAEFMWYLLRLVSPDIPEHSQCAPDTLRFHIFNELLNKFDDYPELHHFIFHSDRDISDKTLNEEKTWELSCRTADLLDQYLFYRGEWISQWENLSKAEKNINADHWQARLWRRCVKDKKLKHWLALQEQFSKNIETFDSASLSQRISFFSMSALSPGYIDLLELVANKTDIHIFIINPCGDVYWGDIQSQKTHSKLDLVEQEYTDVGNPLLASMGKQGRDFIDKLISIQDHSNTIEAYIEVEKNTLLLSQVQQDIYHLEFPKQIENFDINDDSIQYHSCHTPMREVEVIYDQILQQLDSNKSLAPSDIVVMMPDIEKYAPYIESVFSQYIPHNQNKILPFSIADRDPQNIFKIIQALNKLFCLPESRYDVESVFELLEYDDIRTHFDLTQDQLSYCRDLALATNIRWGISDSSRKDKNLPDTEEHTWKYALDRMLLGYALANNDFDDNKMVFKSDRNLHLLPFEAIEGNDALVLAKLKQITDIIFSINDWLHKNLRLEQWFDKTIKLLKLITSENTDQQRILNALNDVQTKADLAMFEQKINFDVFKKILQGSLSEISANEKYLGYGITFCALVPMRSVPFKIVVLMGMNDGEFPRQDSQSSFDLMAKNSRRGDRSRRDEDRYLFLESILSAREKLIVSFCGQSIKDNTEMAPSILVSELLDTVAINSGIQAKSWITKHPLQAFSPNYFKQNSNKQKSLFSYASQYLNLQKNDKNTNDNDKNRFITQNLPLLDESYKELSLTDLIKFFKSPSRIFLKTRFGIQTYNDNDEFITREPFEIESFKDRELRKIIQNNCSLNHDNSILARAKGLLPYGQIGDTVYTKEKNIISTYEEQLPQLENSNEQYFSLKIDEFVLNATINQLSENGRYIKQVSKPYAGDYIDAWITHLCLNTVEEFSGSQKQSLFYSPEKSFRFEEVDNAKQQLSCLLKHYWNGLHFPLLFFPKSSFAMYSKTGKPNKSDMSKRWNGDDRFTGEKDSFENWLLYRNITLNKEQQPDDFLQISHDVFEEMFLKLKEI